MQLMKFTAYIGKSKVATGRGYMRAYRAILENGERLVEAGYGRIEREDGVVVMRIDLDFPIPENRP
jgi:hypothetical protein